MVVYPLQAIYCTVLDCYKTTTGGKPFCRNHVFKMPYLATIDADRANREARTR